MEFLEHTSIVLNKWSYAIVTSYMHEYSTLCKMMSCIMIWQVMYMRVVLGTYIGHVCEMYYNEWKWVYMQDMLNVMKMYIYIYMSYMDACNNLALIMLDECDN